MIYRLDFDFQNEVRLTTGLIDHRQAPYYTNVLEDYKGLVHQASQKCPDIKDLFEQEVYPHFELDVNLNT